MKAPALVQANSSYTDAVTASAVSASAGSPLGATNGVALARGEVGSGLDVPDEVALVVGEAGDAVGMPTTAPSSSIGRGST
jgi:hypothetical protein